MCLTKQHYIVKGIGFGQDWTNGLSHIKMVMSGFITSLHRSRTFKPWVFWELIRVLQYLQTIQIHSCAYVLENVPSLGDFQPTILEAWQQI